MKCSLEKFMRVYDDENGCYYEVRPDADGLGCVQISYSDGGEAQQRVAAIPPDMALLLAKAIVEVATGMGERDD